VKTHSADAILTLVMAGLIAKTGVDIMRQGSGTLADAVALDPHEMELVVLGEKGGWQPREIMLSQWGCARARV